MEEGNTKEARSLSAKDVADAFLNQYYTILQKSPKEAHKFYQDQSTRTHLCADGSMKSATTLEDIDHQIMESIVKEWNPDLDTMHAQESVMGSVILGVTGSLTDNDDVIKHFSQTFFLAPQEGGGFYVHNDFLQLVEVINISEISPSLDDATNSVNALQINSAANESSGEIEQTLKKEQADKSISTKEDAETKNEIADSSKGKSSFPALTNKKQEPNKKHEQLAWKQVVTGQEDGKKVSYASIVAKEGPSAPTSQSFTDAAVRGSSNTDKKPNVPIAVTKPSPPVRSSALPSNIPQDGILDPKSIRVKDLPPKITPESLVELLNKFGSVKPYNIQIKEYAQDGYRYAFVEFDNQKSARLAVEARFIQFEDSDLEIQYKRSYNQGGNYNVGRPMPGRGGFRNDNSWGRDGEGRGSWGNGNWGNWHNEHDNNNGQFSGQARDNNFRRNNRYFQDQGRNFGY
nr:putative G3BP-like protein [Tanacetum cinerariifolium]